MATETYSPGMPIEIGRIDRELKKLWADSEGTMTRASHINLVVYSEEAGSLARNTQMIAQITENRACRAIVVAADPSAKNDGVEAWISAHCHVSQTGSKQVCSEQISFLLGGNSAKFLSSILFSHLDSDLPLYLWWQANLSEPMDPQLWAWIDRLIYDSQSWHDFDDQMRLVQKGQRTAKQRMVLCDLNWTRLVHFRLAFAQFFDHPASHHHFAEIESLRLEHDGNYRSTALLFIGWLAAQLEWEVVQSRERRSISVRNSAGRPLQIELQEKAGAPITSIGARSNGVEFSVAIASCGDLLQVSRKTRGQRNGYQLLPSGENTVVRLVAEELMRGGPHHIYLRALEKIRPLL